jgi:hypothetical protein
MFLQTCINVKFISQYNKSTTFEVLQFRFSDGPRANFTFLLCRHC